ncbi:MAG: 3,4-dihydroxy-2-butanone-4-phosphate synthase [Rhizobiales bacterium]|nr:3,4-dihydroxy-2-butanone-4-phosphate synthase [Hyphomicrobiales bacterium]
METINSGISPIEDIIEDARQGRMFILVDAEDRENEGDLIIPGAFANSDAINFMAKNGRGLICLALASERANKLNLDYMVRHNQARNQTAFTVSIEAREGISTGISAHDRAHTISVAINEDTSINDIVSPGHVFPLIARDGGVLVRAGHTEAAVDIARIAGQNPSGVICEIMNDDGSMARLPDLIEFAKTHDLKIGTIEDLIAYRRANDNLIYKTSEQLINSPFGGEFNCRVYRSKLDDVEHVALIKGNINPTEPTLVRMHGCNVLQDIIGLNSGMSGAETVQKSMEIIGEKDAGVIVLIRHGEAKNLIATLSSMDGNSEKTKETSDENKSERLVEYGLGAQILSDLGLQKIILLSNSKLPKVIGLDSYNLEIVGHHPITD